MTSLWLYLWAFSFGSLSSQGFYTTNLYALAQAPPAWGLLWTWDLTQAQEDQALALQGNALWARTDTLREVVFRPWVGYRSAWDNGIHSEAFATLALAQGSWAYTNHWEVGLLGDVSLRPELRAMAEAGYRQYLTPEIPGFWQTGLGMEMEVPVHFAEITLSLRGHRRVYLPVPLGQVGFGGAVVYRLEGTWETLWSPDPWSVWGLRIHMLRVWGDRVPTVVEGPVLDPDLLGISHSLSVEPWGRVDLPWQSQLRIRGGVAFRWYPWTWDSLTTGETVHRAEQEIWGECAWERHLWGNTTLLVEGTYLRSFSTDPSHRFTEARWAVGLRHYF